MEGRMGGWTCGWVDGWMDSWMEEGMEGWMDRRQEGWKEGWMHGWMDGWKAWNSNINSNKYNNITNYPLAQIILAQASGFRYFMAFGHGSCAAFQHWGRRTSRFVDALVPECCLSTRSCAKVAETNVRTAACKRWPTSTNAPLFAASCHRSACATAHGAHIC